MRLRIKRYCSAYFVGNIDQSGQTTSNCECIGPHLLAVSDFKLPLRLESKVRASTVVQTVV